MYGLQEIKAMNERASNKFYYVCLDCGQTVNEINKDGECSPCVKVTEVLRGD